MPTSKFSQSRPLASYTIAKATLDVLHDYDRLMRCQPLVGAVQKLDRAPDGTPASDVEKGPEHIWFQQTEHIPILPFGIWRKKIIFHNWFKHLPTSPTRAQGQSGNGNDGEGGVESICYAPSSIKIYAVFRVEKRRPDYKKGTIASREKSSNGNNKPLSTNTGTGNGAMNDGNVTVNGNSIPASGDGSDDGDDEGWRIIEETEMTCPNRLILQFSEKQHRAAHGKMLDAIVHEAQKTVYVPSSTSALASASASAPGAAMEEITTETGLLQQQTMGATHAATELPSEREGGVQAT